MLGPLGRRILTGGRDSVLRRAAPRGPVLSKIDGRMGDVEDEQECDCCDGENCKMIFVLHEIRVSRFPDTAGSGKRGRPVLTSDARVRSSAEPEGERCRWGRRCERSGRRGVPDIGAAGSCWPGQTGWLEPRRASGGSCSGSPHDPPADRLGPCRLHRWNSASAAAKVICRQRELALGAWVRPRSRASS